MGIENIDLSSIRHDFHRFPELGFQEKRTKSKIVEFLNDLGLDVHEGAGVVGVLSAGKGEKTIGLRADMDALPIQETSGHDYPSENSGVMHACGHDGHMAMLLGAARILAINPDFDGTVVFLFQPNEENGLGAKAMIKEGVLDQFSIEEIYAIHNLPGVPVGEVLTRIGLICSSESLFQISIQGKGGHASMPQTGRDAITIGTEIVQALQTIVSRKLAPGSGAVVSVTEFLTNGLRNVLPGNATLKGEVRTRSFEDREEVEKQIRQIASGIATAHGVSTEVEFNTELVETINAEEPTQSVIRIAENQGLSIISNCDPMSFSEDFAYFSAAIPGCLFMLGNGETGPCAQPLHSADYDFNDELLAVGPSFWAKLVYDRLPKT